MKALARLALRLGWALWLLAAPAGAASAEAPAPAQPPPPKVEEATPAAPAEAIEVLDPCAAGRRIAYEPPCLAGDAREECAAYRLWERRFGPPGVEPAPAGSAAAAVQPAAEPPPVVLGAPAPGAGPVAPQRGGRFTVCPATPDRPARR